METIWLELFCIMHSEAVKIMSTQQSAEMVFVKPFCSE